MNYCAIFIAFLLLIIVPRLRRCELVGIRERRREENYIICEGWKLYYTGVIAYDCLGMGMQFVGERFSTLHCFVVLFCSYFESRGEGEDLEFPCLFSLNSEYMYYQIHDSCVWWLRMVIPLYFLLPQSFRTPDKGYKTKDKVSQTYF